MRAPGEHQPHLPLDARLPARRRVDLVLARSLRLALWPATWDEDAAAVELLALADGSTLVLAAALARLDRSGGGDGGDGAGGRRAVDLATDALRAAHRRACEAAPPR